MQVLKDEIRLKIIKEAKDLFLKYGFENASMTMMAERVGISKSNLYNYFSSKEDIFYYLTEKAYAQFNVVFDKLTIHEDIEEYNIEEYRSLASKELVELLIEYRDEMLLIMDCSKGTRFENAKEEFILRLQRHSMDEFKKYGIIEEEDDFFAHYISTILVEGLLEIIRHNKSDEWIKNNIELLINYYISGYSHFFVERLG